MMSSIRSVVSCPFTGGAQSADQEWGTPEWVQEQHRDHVARRSIAIPIISRARHSRVVTGGSQSSSSSIDSFEDLPRNASSVINRIIHFSSPGEEVAATPAVGRSMTVPDSQIVFVPTPYQHATPAVAKSTASRALRALGLGSKSAAPQTTRKCLPIVSWDEDEEGGGQGCEEGGEEEMVRV